MSVTDLDLTFETDTTDGLVDEESEQLQADAARFMDPITGEMVAPDNADELIDALERCKQAYDELGLFYRNVREAIADLAEGDTKTRRVRGNRRRAKVVMPSDGWDQAVLKEAYNAYPKFRDEFLVVEKLRVKLREFQKIERESGPVDFEQFKGMVVAANRGPQGLPTVTIEE